MSARGVLGAIDKEKYEVVPIAISRAGRWLPPARAAALLTDGDAGVAGADGDARPADSPAPGLVPEPPAGAADAARGTWRPRPLPAHPGAGGRAPCGGRDAPAAGDALLQRFDVVF